MSEQIQPVDVAERELKTAFAESLLKTPDSPFEAAIRVIPDTGKAMQIANVWLRDPFVVAEKIRLLKENGERQYLPTKEDQLKDIWKMATDSKIDDENRLKAHRLYAEIADHIPKPGAESKVTVAVQNVMIVKEHGGETQWEASAVKQQHQLISHASN